MEPKLLQLGSALLEKTTFFVLGFYSENFAYPTFAPVEIPGAGQYVQLLCTPGDTPILGLGHARTNIGLFVEAILEQPGMTTGGMTVSAFTEQTTPEKLLQSWAKVNGKKALYVEVNIETFTALWTNVGVDILPKMMEFQRYMDKNPWAGSENILTKDDLCVKGLLSVEESFEVLKS
ncbi:hypothetical protein BDV24DRAFT_164635 [Aspergillus arachidicola]|uniref:NmrA-like domain-containing protein n=1 Tax=Aspergillus arachidicola TaxID=656916 RepID=A0A5N6Y3Z5_9EURO|nr:hypothetical protein BDV24DRAFT_164635 [Aspergillus arachidicola]